VITPLDGVGRFLSKGSALLDHKLLHSNLQNQVNSSMRWHFLKMLKSSRFFVGSFHLVTRLEFLDLTDQFMKGFGIPEFKMHCDYSTKRRPLV
jgi:hypothetical protein